CRLRELAWPLSRLLSLAAMPPVGKRKVFKLKRLSAAVQVDKELLEKVAKQARLDTIVIVLPLAAVAHEAGHAKEGRMGTDGRLSLAQNSAQGRDMHFALVRQGQ